MNLSDTPKNVMQLGIEAGVKGGSFAPFFLPEEKRERRKGEERRRERSKG